VALTVIIKFDPYATINSLVGVLHSDKHVSVWLVSMLSRLFYDIEHVVLSTDFAELLMCLFLKLSNSNFWKSL